MQPPQGSHMPTLKHSEQYGIGWRLVTTEERKTGLTGTEANVDASLRKGEVGSLGLPPS